MDAGADPNITVETRWIGFVDGCQKQRKGPLSAIGMARERPDNRKIRRLMIRILHASHCHFHFASLAEGWLELGCAKHA